VSRSAISTGTSCMVEQLGLAMMPSCHSPSSGFTWLTMSGTAGSIRHALELSMTVAPRAAASGASSLETSAAGREEGDVDAFERFGRRLAHRQSPPVGADGRTGRSAGGEQSKLPDREMPLGQDLDHRPPDDAGGADDRDGQRLRARDIAPLLFWVAGTAGSIPADRAACRRRAYRYVAAHDYASPGYRAAGVPS
jgi:hypothetical protein